MTWSCSSWFDASLRKISPIRLAVVRHPWNMTPMIFAHGSSLGLNWLFSSFNTKLSGIRAGEHARQLPTVGSILGFSSRQQHLSWFFSQSWTKFWVKYFNFVHMPWYPRNSLLQKGVTLYEAQKYASLEIDTSNSSYTVTSDQPKNASPNTVAPKTVNAICWDNTLESTLPWAISRCIFSMIESTTFVEITPAFSCNLLFNSASNNSLLFCTCWQYYVK